MIEDKKRNSYVYYHTRIDKNEIFYIGIGSNSRNNKYSRAYQIGKRRNKIWNDIVEKTKYNVKIMFNNLTWDEACNTEKKLILLYGRIDNKTGILSNMTDGGEGVLGCKKSIETRQKMSKCHKGKVFSIETRQKMSKVNTGKKLSEETKRKISESSKGIFSGGKHPSAKKVIDIKTGQIYECAKYAAAILDIKYRTLHSYLTGEHANKTNLKWL
jgi:hypothetical protein